MNITRGKIPGAKKTVVYGPEGIGKSTFASRFPDPVFIDTEGSTKDMDVARMDAPSSWTMLMEEVRYIKNHPDVCRTLVLDTADWAEMLCINHVCDNAQKKSIEDFGYGKGYTYVQEEFGRLLNLLEEVVGIGINVVIAAHARMRKFEQPDEMGAYDRWEMKLSKGVSPLVKEWADMVLFCNYKTIVVNVDGQGAQKGKNKAQGGKRVMYTAHHSCWDAKNRYNLPDEVPFEFEAISHIIGESVSTKAVPLSEAAKSQKVTNAPAQDAMSTQEHVSAPPETTTPPPDEKTVEEEKEISTPGGRGEPVADAFSNLPIPDIPEDIPKALADLMREYKVGEWDIQTVVAARGYYPFDTPIQNYDPDFISGVLVGAWTQVYKMVQDMRAEQEIPFT